MYGLSYYGSTPWVAAATGNPYLKTIMPASGVNDLCDLAFGAGTLDWRFWFFVSGYYHYYGPVLQQPGALGPRPGADGQRRHDLPGRRAGRGRLGRERGHRDDGLVRLLGRAPAAPAGRAQLPRQRAAHPGPAGLERAARRTRSRGRSRCRSKGIHVEELLGQWVHASTPTPRSPDTHAGTSPTGCSGGSTAGSRTTRGADAGAPVEVEDSSGKWRRERRWPPPNARRAAAHRRRHAGVRRDAAKATATLAQDSRSRHYLSAARPGRDDHRRRPDGLRGRSTTSASRASRSRMPSREELRISGLPEVFVDVDADRRRPATSPRSCTAAPPTGCTALAGASPTCASPTARTPATRPPDKVVARQAAAPADRARAARGRGRRGRGSRAHPGPGQRDAARRPPRRARRLALRRRAPASCACASTRRTRRSSSRRPAPRDRQLP